MQTITPHKLKQEIDLKKDFVLLDVREHKEFNYTNIGGTNIPLSQLTTQELQFDHNQKIIVLCHHGMRSAQAATYLKSIGFNQVFNLEGGIDSWSCEVDKTVKRY